MEMVTRSKGFSMKHYPACFVVVCWFMYSALIFTSYMDTKSMLISFGMLLFLTAILILLSSCIQSHSTESMNTQPMNTQPMNTQPMNTRSYPMQNLDDSDCPMCLETMHEAIVTSCNHRFHSSCIHKWLSMHNSCPICRSVVSK